MNSFNDEVCEYNYSTPVTENFINNVNMVEKDQCAINGPYLALKECIEICNAYGHGDPCKVECTRTTKLF
jgi:hypothetical protein